jgi:regulator of sigma E protease
MAVLLDSAGGWLGTVLGIVVGLIPLIILHEFGHFLMAKRLGVWAREFGVGYPPRITKLFRWGETDFTLNWLPFGGFVRLEGEGVFEPSEEKAKELSEEELAAKAEARAHSLYAQSPGRRTLLYLSGPLMNFIAAWVLATLLFMTGIPAVQVVINEVVSGSPAAEAKMQVDDKIIAINGEAVETVDDVSRYTEESLGAPTEVTLERDGQTITVSLVPRVNPPDGQGAMGIVIGSEMKPGQLKHYTPGESFVYGTRYISTMVGLTLALPVYIIRGLIPLKDARPVGIVGIGQIAQRSVEDSVAAGALYPFINMVILISLSLAIFNLLPIPALDGGRILFAVLEKLRGKPLTPELEERIHMVTMALMLVLFLFITALDIVAPVQLP